MEKDTKSSSQAEEIQKETSSVADSQELQKSDLEANKKIDALAPSPLKGEGRGEGVKDDNNKMATEKPSEPIDKDIHEKILEKLDIKQKNEVQDVQEKNLQEQPIPDEKLNDLERIKTKMQVEQAISQDFAKVQKLVESGLINSAQGQNLKKQVLKKAFDMLVQTEKAKRALPKAEQNRQANISVNKNAVFEEFGKSNPDFFTSDGRKEVLNYLQSDNVALGADELNKISGIIRTVEKAAIDRYLQNAAHEKTLRDSNKSAKQRLTANAQKSGSSGNLSRTFTREQIGKMSATEFAKYESQIMEQLKKGMIK